MLVSRWCHQSGPLKVIGHGIGCKTRVKFTIGHWSVSIHLLLVVRSPFVGFVFFLDKSFVRHLYLLTPVKRLFNLL